MRVLKVIALLVCLGVIAGAVVGDALAIVLSRAFPDPDARPVLDVFWLVNPVTAIGAVVGGVTGPIFALLFLRRVPLWRATVETAGAAGLGIAIGIAFHSNFDSPVWYGVVSATLAALRLRYAYRARVSPTQSTSAATTE